MVYGETRIDKANGTVNLEIENFWVSDGKKPFKVPALKLVFGSEDITLPQMVIGNVPIQVAVKNGVARVEKMEAKGKDVDMQLDGQITLRENVPESDLVLDLRFKFNDTYSKKGDSDRRPPPGARLRAQAAREQAPRRVLRPPRRRRARRLAADPPGWRRRRARHGDAPWLRHPQGPRKSRDVPPDRGHPPPGAPRESPRIKLAVARIAELVKLAASPATPCVRARYDAVVVENFGDAPFLPGPVEPVTVAAMTVCVAAAASTGLPVGVNVLRNDVKSALAIAVATGSAFVRVNVHVGAVVADQGLIEGRAHETLRLRRLWGAESVRILADVDVKHAAPLGRRPVGDVVTKDAVLRGLADGVLVTGAATGAKVDAEALPPRPTRPRERRYWSGVARHARRPRAATARAGRRRG